MITLTETAAEKIKANLLKRGKGIGIRLGVKTTGCSGLGYVLEYIDAASPLRPLSFESHGVTVYVETKDHIYLDGITLDWQRQGLNEGFKFINPNVISECGCGSSFNV